MADTVVAEEGTMAPTVDTTTAATTTTTTVAVEADMSRFNRACSVQICTKEGYSAFDCFKRHDASYTPPQKSASAAISSHYGVDSNWYMDTGATDHITSELDKLTVCDKYHGGDQVHIANGSGMRISHVGHGILRSPITNLQLKSILHVPSANKNLLSVNRFTCDNEVFLEFHPNYFVVKEQSTRKLILEGRCENGLYPMRSPNK